MLAHSLIYNSELSINHLNIKFLSNMKTIVSYTGVLTERSVYTALIFLLSMLFASTIMATETNPVIDSKTVNFYNGDFNSAQSKAGNEGKLFFLDFYANWCMPCKWMDQTTFSDSRVAKLMNANYVAIKMDIDQVEGFELKNKYEVQYLPTMLIFNSEGKLIDRIEETMPANRLLSILESHNLSVNKKQVYSPVDTTAPVNSNPTKKQSTTDKDIFERYSASNINRTFRLQIGVYEDYENAFKEVNALKEEFIDPIIVLNDYHNGGVRYKIMLGEFDTIEEAEGFRIILERDFGRNSIVQ